ncbi:MAG: hypothetical protein ACLFN5_07300 [bacterium]
MFKFSGETDVHSRQLKEYHTWLLGMQEMDVVVLGSDPTALACGLELLGEDYSVLLIDEAETPGGRFTWQRGPVEIISPADELLEELGFPIVSNPPLWLDRLDLLSYMCNRFYRQGGKILPGVYIEGPPRQRKDGFEINLLLDNCPLIISAGDVVVTVPKFNPPSPETVCEQQIEDMVLNTGRHGDGWIRAGYQALLPVTDTEYCPMINGCLLSGRKAAHIVFNKKIK